MFCWLLLILIVPWLHKLMSHSHFKTPKKRKEKKVPFQFGGLCEPFKAILKTVDFSIALPNKRFFPISFIIYTVLSVSLSLSFTLTFISCGHSFLNQFSQISVPLSAVEQSQNQDFLPSAKSSSKVCTSHFITPF